MVEIVRSTVLLLVLAAAVFLFACCDDNTGDEADDEPDGDETGDDTDDDSADDDSDDESPPDDDDRRRKLWEMFEEMGFLDYMDFQYTRVEQGPNGYVNYYFSPEDCRCFDGSEAHVAVSHGTSSNVMLFMEGGGARWPDGGFAVSFDFPFDMTFKSRAENNPLKDWNFVYVPHCDNSIHTGDSAIEYNGVLRYHWGARHTCAAVSLIKQLFPDADKILISGSSAGGYGTFAGWAILKSQFMDTDTYIVNDSGTGFWNPYDPETWENIKSAWNVPIPDDCTRCRGTLMTYMYEVYMDYDPQVRIGMVSSYRDRIISTMFLNMDKLDFQDTLLQVTNDIKSSQPDRFNRFFIQGDTHTTYEFLLPEGADYEIHGTSLYEWIGQLVNEDPAWSDLLE